MNFPDDEVEEEDDNGRTLPDVIPTKAPQLKRKKDDVTVRDVTCPDCGCDYVLPCMKLTFTKSFAGNRIQCYWPEKETSNDTALVGCPSCGIIFRVTPSGEIQKTGHSWAKRKAKKS